MIQKGTTCQRCAPRGVDNNAMHSAQARRLHFVQSFYKQKYFYERKNIYLEETAIININNDIQLAAGETWTALNLQAYGTGVKNVVFENNLNEVADYVLEVDLKKLGAKYGSKLKDIMIDFDKVLEKVSKLPKELKKESFRIFVSLLIKYK